MPGKVSISVMLLPWLKGKTIYSCLHATVYYLDGGFCFS